MINASLIYTNQNVIGSKQDIHGNPICLLRNVAAAAGTSNANAFGLLFGYVRASCMHYGDTHSNSPRLSLLAFPAYFSMVNHISRKASSDMFWAHKLTSIKPARAAASLMSFPLPAVSKTPRVLIMYMLQSYQSCIYVRYI